MPARDACVINRVASGIIQTLLLVRTVAYQGHSGFTRSPQGPNVANLRPLPRLQCSRGRVSHPKCGYAAPMTCSTQKPRTPAVLFDVDGTLVDSNYLHVYAWQRAFDAEGVPVAAWRIHRSIGMDGSKLVRTLSDVMRPLTSKSGSATRTAATTAT